MSEVANEITSARSIREARLEMSRAVVAGDLLATEFPSRYAKVVDDWLVTLLDRATGGKTRGYALVAVGGYGRAELSPASDLDLVLVHRLHHNYQKVAEALWYAIWDTGIRLDHSVRTRFEVRTMARQDLRVILGWLDGRLIAGDKRVSAKLFGEVRKIWRHRPRELLAELDSSVRSRHKSAGELAFLLEPDLKQSAGGLRDMAVLRALCFAVPSLSELSSSPAVRDAEETILAARVAVQAETQSSSDRLALQEQDRVAEILGYVDADALMAAIATAGRTIAVASDQAWHRLESLLHPSREIAPTVIEPGIVLTNGDIALADDADVASDQTIVARVARAAAKRGALIEQSSLDRLEAQAVAPASPWSAELRAAFVDLLGTGQGLIGAVEAIDQRHLFELLVPEWKAVRNKPQRNAYHRYTVDRHLLEAIALAAEHLERVQRPDLLLLGVLMHDIGKGYPGDHSEVGQEIAAQMGARMGYPDEDIQILMRLVRYHLLLPELATRRDLDDPSTVAVVARVVEDRQTLELLLALCECDGIATGTSAWGPWKAELVAALAERVGRVIDGHPLTPPPQTRPNEEQLELLQAGTLAVRANGNRVTVVAPDQPGLLAAVTGALALNGCNVRRATAALGTPGMAIETFDVSPTFDREPNWSVIEAEVARILDGAMELDQRFMDYDRRYASSRRAVSAHPLQGHVVVDNETSDLASILEVRAADRLGLLYRITDVLSSFGLDVASAIVDTLGPEVIDTFYLRERSGSKLSDERIEELRARMLGVIEA